MSTPSFRTGNEAAQEAAKKGGGASFSRTHYFALKDGEKAIVRFLTDWNFIPTVNQHNMVPTRPAPADFKGNWPATNTAICRRDVGFKDMGYSDCYICDHVQIKGKPARPQFRQWALAVLREEVMEGGRVVGLRDQVRDVAEVKDGQPTGHEVQEKAIVFVNMAYNNFFSHLDGYYGIYGTLLDRDYVIKRSGSALDTTYQIVPMDPITMDGGVRFDLREPSHMARYEPLPDLYGTITVRSSDDYFARYFDVRHPQPSSFGHKIEGDDSPVAAVAAPSNDVNPDLLAEIAQRVKGYSSDSPDGPRDLG